VVIGLIDGGGRGDGGALLLEHLAHGLAHSLIVVDEKDSRFVDGLPVHRGLPGSTYAGSVPGRAVAED
jgi:hypothetical protein